MFDFPLLYLRVIWGVPPLGWYEDKGEGGKAGSGLVKSSSTQSSTVGRWEREYRSSRWMSERIAAEAEKAKHIYFLFKFSFSSAKPPSIIPGLCFPFCHFSIILSISVGLLSLGCFLFSCFPIFHYLPFFLFKCFYNRVRRMWKLVTIWHTSCSVTTAALWFHLQDCGEAGQGGEKGLWGWRKERRDLHIGKRNDRKSQGFQLGNLG